MLYHIRKKIYENMDKKTWKKTDKVYGIYNENNEIVYIGRSCDIKKRFEHHKKQYNNHSNKELKKGDDENINWEIAYIQWYGLKYDINNKLHRLKQYRKEKEVKDNFNKYEYNPKFKNYYKLEYMYKNPLIQKYDIIDSKCISKYLKKNMTGESYKI